MCLSCFSQQGIHFVLSQDIGDLGLADGQIFLVFQDAAHLFGILGLVSLCAQGVNGRSLGNIEHLGLDKGLIYIFGHFPAQSVDFPDQVALGGSPDVGIAGHHGYAVHIHCEYYCVKSQTAAGKCSFAARVSGSDHADVRINMINHTQYPSLRIQVIIFIFC